MEDTINKIIELEEKAQKIVETASKKKEHMSEDVNSAVEKLHQGIDERVKKKSDSINSTEADYADKKIEALKNYYRTVDEGLTKHYEEKKDEWVENIYTAIVDMA